MKEKDFTVLNVCIECVHFTIIAFALSAMAFVFRSSPLFILFFASEVALLPDFWGKLDAQTHRRVLNVVLILVCFGAQLLLAYLAGLPALPISAAAQ